MNAELNKVEARQGDRRQMNMRVLFWGVPAAFVLAGRSCPLGLGAGIAVTNAPRDALKFAR